MTETTCPICGGKCIKTIKEPRETGHIYSEHRHKALPQPDLTKLRETYEKYEHLDRVMTDLELFRGADFKYHLLYTLWQAIKEVLDAEASEREI